MEPHTTRNCHSSDDLKATCNCQSKTLTLFRRMNGYIIAFASACLYACMAILVSSLGEEMKSLTLTFVRAFVSAVFSFVVMCYQGIDMRIESTAELKFHLMNSVLVTAAMVCQFYAYHHMPAANASAILYGYVAFTGLYGRVLLKESFGILGVAMVILTFLGILMIARPPFVFHVPESGTFESDTGGIFPAIVAIAGTQTIALSIVTIRAMGKQNIPVMKMTFYTMAGTIAILAVPITVLGQWSIPRCMWGKTRMVISAVCGFLGYAGMSYALSVENAVYVSLVTLNDALVVFLVSIIFMGFKPTWLSVTGMFLIIGSSVVILLRKVKVSHTETQEQSVTPDVSYLRFAEHDPLTDAYVVRETAL